MYGSLGDGPVVRDQRGVATATQTAPTPSSRTFPIWPLVVIGGGVALVWWWKRRPKRNPARRRRRYLSTSKRFISKRMRDFGKRRMRDRSGRIVTSRKQAIAIALSEARSKGYKVPKRVA